MKKPRTRRGRRQDGKLASRIQKHEVAYLARKHGLTPRAVRAAIKIAGPSRKRVENELARWVS